MTRDEGMSGIDRGVEKRVQEAMRNVFKVINPPEEEQAGEQESEEIRRRGGMNGASSVLAV